MKYDPIPHLYWVNQKGKNYPNVRAQFNGRRKTAPATNDWLKEKGRRPIEDRESRAAAIHAILEEELRNEAQQGFHPERPLTVKEAVATFLRSLRELPDARKPIPKQLQRTESVLSFGAPRRPSLVSVLKGRRVDKVTREDLNRLHVRYEKAGYRPETIKSYFSDIRRFFNWCCEVDLMAKSPIRKGAFQMPSGGELDLAGAAYTPEDVDRIERALKPGTLLYRAFLLALYTGARRSEIAKVRFEDLSLGSQGYVQIHGARKNLERRSKLRLVPLHPELASKLGRRLGAATDFVVSGGPKPTSPNALKCAIARFNKKTGLSLGLQRLRRTFGQRVFNSGSPIDTVAGWMGNSPETLERWYLMPALKQFSPEALKALSDRGHEPGKRASLSGPLSRGA
jgi:integrase